MPKNNLVFIIAVLVILVSCKKNPTSSNQNDYLIPLEVGNSWSWRVEPYDRDQDDDEIYFDLQITDTMSLQGDIWYGNGIHYFRNDNIGFWQTHTAYDTIWLVFKYPASSGEIWSNGESTLINTKASINGFDNCYLYQESYSGYGGREEVDKYFIKPGIGWVFIILDELGDSNKTYTLTDYELN
ncbi:MAG: hypothetical protein V3U16_06795 [Candidatus Neomarinimicrobiota bacterium]